MLLKAGTFTLENSVTCVVSVDDNLFLLLSLFQSNVVVIKRSVHRHYLLYYCRGL